MVRRVHEMEGELKSMEETTQRLSQEQRLLLEYPDLNGPVNNAASGNVMIEFTSNRKTKELDILEVWKPQWQR